MDRRRLVLDTDPGIDDAVMIAYLAAEPTAEIVAVGSTHPIRLPGASEVLTK